MPVLTHDLKRVVEQTTPWIRCYRLCRRNAQPLPQGHGLRYQRRSPHVRRHSFARHSSQPSRKPEHRSERRRSVRTGKGYRFKGRAEVLEAGAEFERLVAIFGSRGMFDAPRRVRAIVVMRVAQAAPLISPGYDRETNEETVRAHWVRYYLLEMEEAGIALGAEPGRQPRTVRTKQQTGRGLFARLLGRRN